MSPAERRALTRAHAFVQSHGTALLGADAGRVLADALRRVLVDVDDVTIGRVALQVAVYLKELAEENASDVTAIASDQLLLAALELTAIELRE